MTSRHAMTKHTSTARRVRRDPVQFQSAAHGSCAGARVESIPDSFRQAKTDDRSMSDGFAATNRLVAADTQVRDDADLRWPKRSV